eukprot:COSAG01_NODE_5383_length_4295_cov_2.871306_6_plen_81_part_00
MANSEHATGDAERHLARRRSRLLQDLQIRVLTHPEASRQPAWSLSPESDQLGGVPCLAMFSLAPVDTPHTELCARPLIGT